MEGLLIACEKPTLKQTITLIFHCETVPLANNIIEQNQVVCKFPSYTTDDGRTVEDVLV